MIETKLIAPRAYTKKNASYAGINLHYILHKVRPHFYTNSNIYADEESSTSSSFPVAKIDSSEEFLKLKNSPSIDDALPHWRATQTYRQQILQKKTITPADYISQIPVLNTDEGYRLVRLHYMIRSLEIMIMIGSLEINFCFLKLIMDADTSYTINSIDTSWHELSWKLIKYASSRRDKVIQNLLVKYNLNAADNCDGKL